MFAGSTDKHSVYVTSKRASSQAVDGDVDMTPSSSDVREAVLFRATNGATGPSRVKISTVVVASQLATFQTAYLALLRAQLAPALKKRDKAKERKVDKLKEQSRKKLVRVVDGKEQLITNHIGAKRGAGRRKRQRALAKGMHLRKEKAKDAKRKKQSTK